VIKTHSAFCLVHFCGECRKPNPSDVCGILGYNPGTDGHLFDSPELASSVRESFLECWKRDHPGVEPPELAVSAITLSWEEWP
jgi:hypothetical protein